MNNETKLYYVTAWRPDGVYRLSDAVGKAYKRESDAVRMCQNVNDATDYGRITGVEHGYVVRSETVADLDRIKPLIREIMSLWTLM